jgi:2-dehydro-3-deoxyphosphogluconate aldolase/(4S)-4-hydroxy-2-oxoglutarate aldolase
MTQEELMKSLKGYGVVPVIAIEAVDSALPLADALAEGGLPVAEITFRTAAGGEVIARIAKDRPNVILGAGTVLSLENLRAAKTAGARFGVAPGTNPDIVAEAARLGLPFIPGVVTPSEVEKALALGAKIQKFFPSEASGGVSMIKALAAPYGHTGVKFVPTGGVSLANLEEYLKNEAVLCVGGTWIATKELIKEKKWSEIRDNCRKAMEVVRRVRG